MVLLDSAAWTFVDDSGPGTDGTAFDAAKLAALKASIEAQTHSTANPTILPKTITDEVKTARGNLANLGARIGVVVDVDGNPILPGSAATQAMVKSQYGLNMWPDSLVGIWPDGDTSAPWGYVISGTGAAVARCGSGGASYEASPPADTTQLKFGNFCAKLTYGSAIAGLTRTFTTNAAKLGGLTIAILMHCKTSVASAASIVVSDGISSTRGGSGGNDTFHAGDNVDRIIYCTHTISASATSLTVKLEMAQAGSAYFGAGAIARGSLVPDEWFPERWGWGTMGYQIRGNLATGDIQNEWREPFPWPAGLFQRVQGRVKTAPLTTAIQWDHDRYKSDTTLVGALYATKPQIAASAKSGTKDRPDGTYRNRCFVQDDFFTTNIDAIGTGTVGDEMCGTVVFWVPMDEFAILAL